MNWNDVPIALAVARTGTLSGAAELLGKNHSTVFRRLNTLEQALGVRLFDRLSTGYVPTAIGRSLLADAERAADAIDDLARQAQGADRLPTGDVRLTTAGNLATYHVAPIVAELARTHPGLRVQVVVSYSEYDLSRREADLALRATRAPPPNLIGRKVLDYQWFLMGSPEYLDRHPAPVTEASFAQHRFIGADSTLQRLPALSWLHDRVAPAQFVGSANAFSVMAAMATAGMGLAALPSDQVSPLLRRVLQIPLSRAEAGALWLLNHPDLREVARVRTVAEALYRGLRASEALARA